MAKFCGMKYYPHLIPKFVSPLIFVGGYLESFLKYKLKRPSKRVNGKLHHLKHYILIQSYETRQFSLASKFVYDNYSEQDVLNDGLEIISLDAKMKVLSSPSNKEGRCTKNLPSLPARVQFSALAING